MGIVIETAAYLSALWVIFQSFKIIKLQRQKIKTVVSLPLVSIIVPARNEEKNIGRLLQSLKQLDYPGYEIFVSDDASNDNTVSLAKEFNVKVYDNPEKPASWVGKSWACWRAAQQAKGELILFTDADTIHKPDSLKRAVTFLKTSGSSLISAAQFHRNEKWWEKLLGPFYCLLNIGAQTQKESIANPYAMGHYLLIDRNAYFRIGGHKQIKEQIADDASLAKAVMSLGLTYRLYHGKHLCSIQMYHSFKEFINGWLRILRLGMQELKSTSILATIIPLLALNLYNIIGASLEIHSLIPLLVVMITFSFLQYVYGNFSIIGILLFPVGLLLFLALSLNAFIQHLLKTPISWKGRIYNQHTVSDELTTSRRRL